MNRPDLSKPGQNKAYRRTMSSDKLPEIDARKAKVTNEIWDEERIQSFLNKPLGRTRALQPTTVCLSEYATRGFWTFHQGVRCRRRRRCAKTRRLNPRRGDQRPPKQRHSRVFCNSTTKCYGWNPFSAKPQCSFRIRARFGRTRWAACSWRRSYRRMVTDGV